MIIRIGTRGSALALAQSGWVKARIEAAYPDVKTELVRITTKGDKILDSPLSKIGGKGLFIKEIEEALLREEVDIAVHSMKDVPAELPVGLEIPLLPKREDPRDAFVAKEYGDLESLPKGAAVGTGSLRRSAQLLHARPDLEVIPLRGNVDTRLKKLESSRMDAIILAAAGLRRLGLSHQITSILSPEAFLPAAGQGAIGLELRKDDRELVSMLGFIHHKETALAVQAERAFLEELEGGCQVPLGALATMEADGLILQGIVAELDGSRIVRDQESGPKDKAEEIGRTLAKRILSAGADGILSRIYGRGENPVPPYS